MPFETFEIHSSKAHLVATSVKHYRTELNRLAKLGYDTIPKLITNKKAIIKYVSELGGDSPKDKQKKRFVMSAIFFALAAVPQSKIKMYYTYFQTLYPTQRFDGSAWTSKEEWKQEKEERKEDNISE
jgi:hypothetical protein